MADRKPFLLRMDRDLLDAVQRWANDDLRSVNGQIEFLLRDALRRAGRSPARSRRASRVTDEKASDEAATDEKAPYEKATDDAADNP